MTNGIQKIYSEIPKTYELINHILTFGFDIYCRRKAVKLALADGGERFLDICSGTGEIACYLKAKSNGTQVVAADFSLPMMKIGAAKPEAKDIKFIIAEAGQLPFADDYFDLVTISFATRNINKSREALIGYFSEFRRVLKPGGRFINLETSQPPNRTIRKLMHLYVDLTVRKIGRTISGSKYGYNYLATTIPRFYGSDELTGILKEAGFSKVYPKPMFFGAAAIHKAVK
jgi:demethylmenaquinone methyltransferase/2-methoxy-6-polyprenyl-1,4-benzoquinol methylase